jgi:DNA-nicking Smr family endonuclease
MAGPVWREIDLHGMDRVSARRLVMETLESCRRAGVKRLRIVHGKGTGVPREGGDGAVEVRLDWSR